MLYRWISLQKLPMSLSFLPEPPLTTFDVFALKNCLVLLAKNFWSCLFPCFPTFFYVTQRKQFCCFPLLLYSHFLMYCFLQVKPFAARLLPDTQGAAGLPNVLVRSDRSGLEQNLSELVIHTTAVLQSINYATVCEPLRLLMDNPAALMVQFCFIFLKKLNFKYELQIKQT